MNSMIDRLLKYVATALFFPALLMGKASIAHAADADCRPSGLSGSVNTVNVVNVVNFGSNVAVPYAAAVGATIATQAWNAPSSGLDNPSVIIMQCRKAGDLRIKIVANQTDPTPRGSAGFLQALSPNINVRFTLGTDTSNSSMWMNTTGTGNTTTIPNTIPDVADIGGGPLNPSLASANFTSQPAGTYNLTLAR